MTTGISATTFQSSQANNALKTSMQKLSSGKNINNASDNAAGLAIATEMLSNLGGINQSVHNLNDGVSLIQSADFALQSITDATQRIRDLAVQASNGTLNSQQRQYLQNEANELREEIYRTIDTTEFNGQTVLATDDNLQFQTGENATDTISITTRNLSNGLNAVGFDGFDLSSAAGASNSLDVLDQSISSISRLRSQFGASENRFASTINHLQNMEVNTSEALSRVMDTDYAVEISNLTRASIFQEAETAILAQSNQNTQNVLNFLSKE